ncbi:type II toxin-antitoxin system HipA family toxin [Ferrovum sp.]|uniref:type II toxin-antitoxin system HipA family toxin n=1 Tax=Ferrovum sp. TaxID=2609467 RepID=UPI00260A3874|nr:type II toxin-antitoxin system HipA family toxin [Ferrovum sp.]
MRIDVHLTRPDAERVKIGMLDCGEISSSGKFESSFSYSPEWLDHKNFFPVDPESLHPHNAGHVFRATGFNPPLSVFQDSLPDDWGRRLLIANHQLRGYGQQALPNLLLKIGEGALGALSFFQEGEKPRKKTCRSGNMIDLGSLMESAEKFAKNGARDTDPKMAQLFLYGSSPGGARPKALVTDGTDHWIAKFGNFTRDKGLDVAGAEHLCMVLAHRAGLEVAETRLERFVSGNAVLVKRFDLSESGGRFHIISLQTLCKEAPGRYVLSYQEVFEKVCKHSSAPVKDASMFFRQMCFNAVIGNVDDHLKNFAMIGDKSSFRLSPAFDLLPDITRKMSHTLMFQYSNFTNGRELVEIGKFWGVDDPAGIVREVCDAASRFSSTADDLGISLKNTGSIVDEIEERASCFSREATRIRPAG